MNRVILMCFLFLVVNEVVMYTFLFGLNTSVYDRKKDFSSQEKHNLSSAFWIGSHADEGFKAKHPVAWRDIMGTWRIQIDL